MKSSVLKSVNAQVIAMPLTKLETQASPSLSVPTPQSVRTIAPTVNSD